MPASTRWAASLALVLIVLALTGATVWQRRHPDTSVIARVAAMLPEPPASMRAAIEPQAPAPAPAPAPGAPTASTAPTAPQPQQPTAPLAQAGEPAPPPGNKPAAALLTPAPRFDVVRVEPKGDTLVAGTGAPHAKVALLASGKVVAEATTDAAGQFVILPPPLPPGAYDLTLRQTQAGAPGAPAQSAVSKQSVAVAVPAGGDKDHLVVALAEPGRPTKLLSTPTDTPRAPAPESRPGAAKPAAPQTLGIRSVELENGSGFYATGTAKPGTPVHVYLNETHLADVVAGADGAWSVTIRKGLAGGRYRVRADAGGATVSARAEVSFDVPTTMSEAATAVSPADSRAPGLASLGTPRPEADAAQARASADRARQTPTGGTLQTATLAPALPLQRVATAASGDAAPDAARAVIEEIQTQQVLGGDNLWRISRERLGFGRRFTQIYAANATQIRDPKLIYPGQVFVLPPR